MEPARKVQLIYLVVIALLVAAAGALWYSYQQEIREAERLAAAMRDLHQEREALQAEVATLQSRVQALEGALESARAQAEKLAQGLGETERKAQAAAAARAELSRTLEAKEQTLEEARARSAELNQAYEALLKDKSQLAAASAEYRAELERTRKSFEEVQNLIARLTGARGVYTVQYGDSLSKIAAFFYHDAYRWPDIRRANAHLIRHPDLIYPLQVLIVPQ